MSKLYAVARREYRETVRKKSFLIVTALMPLLFGGLMFIPQLMLSKTGGVRRVLVLDGTGQLREPVESALSEMGGGERRSRALAGMKLDVEVRAVDDVDAAAARESQALSAKGGLSAVVAVPRGIVDGSAPATYYSRASTDVIIRERVHSALNRGVTRLRAATLGIGAEATSKLLQRIELSAIQVTREGSRKSGGELNFLIVFVFAIMLLLPTIFQSQEIMRGILQEKTDRIIETLVSSMSAFDLLTGKVLGLAAVGLTQIAIWSAMAMLASSAGVASLAAMGINPSDFVTPGKLLWFALFYLLGYFMNACVFAIAGASANSEKEAQQVLQPAMILLMVPWILMMPIVTEPDGTLATALSLAPMLCPLPMFVRILVGSPPAWQVALSIASALASILFLFWLAAKIFRVGILWYGKRPSLPEFLRWARMP